MLKLIGWRLAQTPVILAIIFAVTFTLAWIIPGNPLDRPEGQRPPVEVQQAMLRQYNLDSPWRFLRAYAVGVLTKGDLGPSLQYGEQRVTDIIAEALPANITLGAAAILFALVLGLAAGVIGAMWPGSIYDTAGLAVALVGISLPIFVTGSLLLIVFGGLLAWAPIGGWGSPAQIILPAITLAAAPAAYIARLTRLGLADVMTSDFIRTARAKGVSQWNAVRKHALKVAFLPVLSFLGPATAAVMTGSFVVEKVFNIPGLGGPFVTAVLNKDQFLILGIVLVYSLILILMNLAVDVAYTYLDPRIQQEAT